MAEIPANVLTEVEPDEQPARSVDDLVQDVLVEEISIDGMCGVY